MATNNPVITLVDGYTSADASPWVEIKGAANGLARLHVMSDNVFDGKTVALELRDPDGTDAGTTVTLETSTNAFGASTANHYLIEGLTDGDEIRVNPSAGGGSMSLHIVLVPLTQMTAA